MWHSLFDFSEQFYLFIIFSIGNFGFGIDEHIDLGIKYDTSTGIFGMDFTIVLKRAGDRVSKRRAKKGRVGKFQSVTKDDAKLWFIETLGGTILNWVIMRSNFSPFGELVLCVWNSDASDALLAESSP